MRPVAVHARRSRAMTVHRRYRRTTPWDRIAAALLFAAALGGCGGGGNAPPPDAGARQHLPPGLPADVPREAYLWIDSIRPGAPVMDFDGTLHVGADVAPPAAALARTGSRGGAALWKGALRDGIAAEDVVDYLRQATEASLQGKGKAVSGLATFPETQVRTVKLAFTERTRNRFTPNVAQATEDAVRIVNAALPFGQQLRLDPEFETRHLSPALPNGRSAGDITVWFIPKSDDRYPLGAPPEELGRGTRFFDPRDEDAPVWEVDDKGAFLSSVLIATDAIETLTAEEIAHVLVHELLHAIAFVGHTDGSFAATLTDAAFVPGTQPRGSIHPIDRAALLAAYGRLKPGTRPDDMSAESLRPWTDTSFHLRGDLDAGPGGMAFGVAHGNGLAQGWASGPAPETTLGGNPALAGSVTWTGALLGIAAAGREVTGDAALTIDLDDQPGRPALDGLQGELAFTGLRFEDGGIWGDGDLHYTIRAEGPGRLGYTDQRAANANTFERADAEFRRIGDGLVWTGRDLGTVTGAFFGPRHETMGGVLERHDLTAAFGGKR